MDNEKNNIELSIIYVYYNSFAEIKKSIESIINGNQDLSYEIIIVINGDDCNQANLLTQLSNKIKIVHAKENIGFGSANNLGAKNSNGKYILILNPDTIVYENTLSYIIDELKDNGDIGLANCKLLTEDKSIQKTAIYKRFSPTYLILEYFFVYKWPIFKNFVKSYFYNDNDYDKVQNPEVISGAFMMFKRELYTSLKGFDEDFFMYSEDHNICLRAGKKTKILYLPEVSVTHTGAHSLGNLPSENKLSLMMDSIILNIEKIFGKNKRLIFQFFLVINAITLYPISYFIKNEVHKSLLKIRSKVILKRLFN